MSQPASGVTYRGEEVTLASVAEAKLTIKQLKLTKKELANEKKVVNAEMTRIRAEQRVKVGNRGSTMRGGGGFGKTVRAVQQVGRDADRARHANTLAPLEQQKAGIEARSVEIDGLIV